MNKSGFIENEFITFKNSQGIAARGVLHVVSQNQIVFETYNPYSVVQLSEVLNEVTICRVSETLKLGKAVVNNLINTGLILIISATLVEPWIEQIKSSEIVNVEEKASSFVVDWNLTNSGIKTGYQLIINKIRSYLTEMNRWLRQFEMLNKSKLNNEDLIDKVSKPLLVNLAELFFEFEGEAVKINNSEVQTYKSFAQNELHSLIMCSPFAHRTFLKPLGYAGDYEMVNMMFRNRYEGETIYAKIINSFLLGPGPAESHRNRIDILYDKLKEIALKCKKQNKRAKIFNFACGPAIELQRFIELEDISENCDIVILDFSEETLKYTLDKLEQIKKLKGRNGVTLRTIHKSVNDVLRNAVKDKKLDDDNKFDFIYCAGLFDYLSDKVCSKLLELFFHQLEEDSLLLATNVHIDNPARFIMEHLLEWYLIYRDEQGFNDLINVDNKKTYVDVTGFNVFLEIQK